MRLHTNPASPFGRKVKVLAHETGLLEHLELLDQVLTPVAPSDAGLGRQPAGQDPLPRHRRRHGPLRLTGHLRIPGQPAWRPPDVPGRGTFALAGADLASTGRRHHGCRSCYPLRDLPPARDPRWPDWVQGQKLKIVRALDRLESEASGWPTSPTSGSSRSAARSAISTSATRSTSGARSGRSLQPGSSASMPARRCRRPVRARSEPLRPACRAAASAGPDRPCRPRPR